MNTCPVKDSKWKKFVAYFEEKGLSKEEAENQAYREHIYTDGDLRDPEVAYNDFVRFNENKSSVKNNTEVTEKNKEILSSEEFVLLKSDDITGEGTVNDDLTSDTISQNPDVKEFSTSEEARLSKKELNNSDNIKIDDSIRMLKSNGFLYQYRGKLRSHKSYSEIKEYMLKNDIDESILSYDAKTGIYKPNYKEKPETDLFGNPIVDEQSINNRLSKKSKVIIEPEKITLNNVRNELNSDLEKSLYDFLSEYNIEFNISEHLSESENGIYGYFDAINKVITVANNREETTLPDVAAQALVRLLYHTKDMKFLVRNIHKTSYYKTIYSQYKNLYTDNKGKVNETVIKQTAIAKYISNSLLNNGQIEKSHEYETKEDKTIWQKIIDFINSILDNFSDVSEDEIISITDNIARNVLENNKDALNIDAIDSSKMSPVSYEKTFFVQNSKDGGFAENLMQFFTEIGNVVTGSLSLRYQGVLKRKSVGDLHDIDMKVPYESHHIDGKFKHIYSKKRNDIRNLAARNLLFKEISETPYFQEIIKKYPYFEIFNAFPCEGHVTVNAIICKDDDIRKRFAAITFGSYDKKLSYFTKEEQEQIYLLDFFLYEKGRSVGKIYDEKHKINLSPFKEIFPSKFTMARAKDIFDYQSWKAFEDFKNVETSDIMYSISSSGRELFSGELEALVPGCIKETYKPEDREDMRIKMQQIASKYGVEFKHFEEFNHFEKPRWSCSEPSFLSFINFYSNNFSNRLSATKKQYEIWKALNGDSQVKTEDYDFAKQELNSVIEDRKQELKRFCEQYSISKSDMKSIQYAYCDPMFNDYDSLSKEERELLLNIRTKIKYIKAINPDIYSIVNEDFNYNLDMINSVDSDQIKSENLCARMSEALGVEYEIITEEQTEEILKGSKSTFKKGETSAFTYKGKVYFIKGKLTKNTVLHEFAHPLIQYIAKTNPVLFEDLYAQLTTSEEGQRIIELVKSQYDDFDEESPEFKEECIVTAIEQYSKSSEKTSWFSNVIKNIINAIKKVFRALGISDTTKISEKTTISDLSEMLKNVDKFQIETDVLTDNDIAMYKRDITDLRNNVNSLYSKQNSTGTIEYNINQLNENMTNTFNALRKYKTMLEENPDFIALGKTDLNKFNNSELQENIRELTRLIDIYTDNKRTFNDVVEEFETKANAFCRSLYLVQSVLQRMNETVGNMNKNNLTKTEIQILYSYNNMLSHWSNYYQDIYKSLSSISGYSGTTLSNVLSDFNNSINNTRNAIDDIYLDIATDTIYDQMSSIYDQTRELFEERNKALEHAPQALRDREFQKYYGLTEDEYNTFIPLLNLYVQGRLTNGDDIMLFNKLKMKSSKGLIKNKDQIKLLIKGELGDTRYFNSKFEGYLYSDDPVISGFALFHKKQMEKAHIRTLQKYSQLVGDIEPELRALNLNKTKIGGLGKLVLFKDKVYKEDENGNPVETYVWRFKNPFKNYSYDYDMLRKKMNKARDKWKKGGTDAEKEAYFQAKKEFNDFKMKYMNQKYTDEYYKDYNTINDLFDNTTQTYYGRDVLDERESILDEIRSLKDQLKVAIETTNDLDENEQILSEIDDLNIRMARLASITDEYGNKKTGIELKKAIALREHNERMSKYYEYDIDYDKFESDFLEFRQSLLDTGLVEGSPEFQVRIESWCKRNMSYGTTIAFEEAVRNLKERISAQAGKNAQKEKLYIELHSIIAGLKDEFGEIDETKITEDAIKRIRVLREQITKIRGSHIDKNLLTQLDSLVKHVPTKGFIEQLENILSLEGITSADLYNLFGVHDAEQLAEHFTYENFYVSSLLRFPHLKDFFNKTHYDASYKRTTGGVTYTVTKYKRNDLYDLERPKDPKYELVYEITDPQTGVVIAKLPGKPGKRYKHSFISDQYLTPKIVNQTVDNRGRYLPKSRQQLDSSVIVVPLNERYKYMNEEYESLPNDSPLKSLIDKLVANHLSAQEDTVESNRLYLDAPRFRSDTAEIIAQSFDNGLKETFSTFMRRVRYFIQGAPDDYENGISNYDVNQMLVETDTIQDNLAHIPVSGLYELEVKDVSTNILRTMMRYIESIENEKAMREASPIVKAIQTSVDNSTIKSEKADKSTFDVTGKLSFLPTKDGHNYRREAIDNLIEREYEGIKVKGFGKNALLMNVVNKLMGFASFSFFGMNIPSALKNSYGIKFQALLESSSKRYMDMKSLEKGNRWAYKMMTMESLGGFYNATGDKTLERQIVELFDFAQDNTSDTFMDPLWRSIGTDILEGKPLYAPRKWVEHQATFQVGSGVLFFNKVAVQNADGTFSYIPYMDAFHLNDGLLTTRDDIDVRYCIEPVVYELQQGDTIESLMKKFNLEDNDSNRRYITERVLKNRTIDEILFESQVEQQNYIDKINEAYRTLQGKNLEAEMNHIEQLHKSFQERKKVTFDNEKFTKIRNQIHQVNNDLGGAYAKFDQPDMHRYFLYKLTMYLRRYATTMFGKRFRTRDIMNAGLGEQQKGYYIQTFDFFKGLIMYRGEYLKYASDQEKEAVVKTLFELFLINIIPLLLGLLFDYDDDDDDRYNKLRKKSAALYTPLSQEDKTRKFNILGFASLHLQHLMMQVKAENEQFNPLAGGLKGITGMGDLKSVVLGPTTDTYLQIITDIQNMIVDDPSAYYSRNIGPYKWQQKKSAKIWNHTLKMIGLTGTSLDPALAIQNFEANASKVRR